MWKHSSSGELSLIDVYLFKSHHLPTLHWAKTICHKDIPPSKSLVAWRLMQEKLPTDENLLKRGCYLPSTCNLCKNSHEFAFHLFFDCPYAIRIWTIFQQLLTSTCTLIALRIIRSLVTEGGLPNVKLLSKPQLIINIIATIRFARNQARFNNMKVNWK